jgi:hypothetical protein
MTPSEVPGEYDNVIAYDMILFVTHRDERVDLFLMYNTELFVKEGATRFLEDYIATVERLCAG